tara:strand:- start:9736 stop:10296 length:561 start_codon:yes stop_codon:yes gene_type:complete
MASTVGNRTIYQQLDTVTPNTWTDLIARNGLPKKDMQISKIVIQNTGADDIQVSLKFVSRDIAPPNTESDGEILTSYSISGSTRRSGLINNLSGTNPVNFSKPMAPHVEGGGLGGYDAHSFGDWNGLTYSGRKEIEFFENYTFSDLDIQSLQFKCDKASGFKATVILTIQARKVKMGGAGGTGVKM